MIKTFLRRILRYIRKRLLFIFPQKKPGVDKDVPKELYNAFTLEGKIPIVYFYFSNYYPPSEPLIYEKNTVESFIKEVKNGSLDYYSNTGIWLMEALHKHRVEGLKAVVMGSDTPRCESIVLAYGAKHCTTIEYNKIISLHPQINCITPAEYDKIKLKFDVGFSISSFEHDGLGRYGDPINPDADLNAMKAMKSIIKKNGLLFLAVPVGRDTLVWNAHRIYGRLRLQLLIDEWEVIDSFGFKEKHLKKRTYLGGDYVQPVFVLRNISRT